MKEMTTATSDVSQQIKSITQANIEHSADVGVILETLTQIRRVADRNALGVRATLVETTSLLGEADEITAYLNSDGWATSTKKRSRGALHSKSPDMESLVEADKGSEGSPD